jgi:hypothetical protein
MDARAIVCTDTSAVGLVDFNHIMFDYGGAGE